MRDDFLFMYDPYFYNSIRGEYIVQSGDSLYTIASKNNTTVDEIKNLII